MTFRSHNGLTEMRRFSDLFNWVTLNPRKIVCPECWQPLKGTMFKGLNMDLAGYAEFICKNDKCPQSRRAIKIETIWRDK